MRQRHSWKMRFTGMLHTVTGEPQPLAKQIAVAENAVGAELRLHAVRPGLIDGETTRVMFADPALGPSENRPR